MKTILSVIAMAVIVTACNSNASIEKEVAARMKAHQDSLQLDSFRKAEVIRKDQERAAALAAAQTRAASANRGSTNNYYHSNSGSYSQAQPVKRGWSSAAKGAVIGGAAGALAGVAVDKTDGRGAVIGGLIGAGTGYVIGRSRDRKTGRVQ